MKDLGQIHLCPGPGLVQITNFAHLLVSQLRMTMVPASRLSPLRHFVGDIVGVRSEEEVGRVGARRIVAAVSNDATVGQLAVGDLPGDDVRFAFKGAGHGHGSVALIECAGPDPAFIRGSDGGVVAEPLLEVGGDEPSTQRPERFSAKLLTVVPGAEFLGENGFVAAVKGAGVHIPTLSKVGRP